MARISIDPITRIEGHLKIEVEVSDGQVTSAWSSGTLFRGIEPILIGRLPEQASLFTQRACGVCTYVHAVTSTRAVEQAAGITIPSNARLIRNLLMGGQWVHDHPIHFYHLSAVDFVDVVSALSANPARTQALAKAVSPQAPNLDFAAMQQRLQAFAAEGRLGIYNRGFWGHPAYRLTPEENLLFVGHYLHALHLQVSAAKMHAIFGAKNPHLQSLRVGGVTCGAEITSARIAEFRTLLSEQRLFIDTLYVPDVCYLAQKYPDWGSLGGYDNYLVYGDFPATSQEPSSYLFPRGAVLARSLAQPATLDPASITEHVAHSWYQGTAAQPPATGSTDPAYTSYDTLDRYSWLKAPRYAGQPMEVGPLARVLVAYAAGNAAAKSIVASFLRASGLVLGQLHSTLGRVAARALETKLVADQMDGWLSGLVPGEPAFVASPVPSSGTGWSTTEAPRGALGHWMQISNGTISRYQMVVPSTWNFGPRCAANLPGPVEQALVGTPVADPTRPIEILRTVHSYDPCIGCAVHVVDTQRHRTCVVRAV
jgi:[NiFe] hydrogenase large subunit